MRRDQRKPETSCLAVQVQLITDKHSNVCSLCSRYCSLQPLRFAATASHAVLT